MCHEREPEHKHTTRSVRASDAERERVAKLVSDAAGEGRLTLEEAEERLELVYATRFRHELDQYVADLPAQATAAAPIRGPGRPFPEPAAGARRDRRRAVGRC